MPTVLVSDAEPSPPVPSSPFYSDEDEAPDPVLEEYRLAAGDDAAEAAPAAAAPAAAAPTAADGSSHLRLSRDGEYVPSTNGTAIAIATAIIAAAKPSLRSYLRGCSVVVARTRCSCGLAVGYFTLPPASPQCRFRSFYRTSPPFANVRRGSLIFLKTPLLKDNDERKERNELMNSTATVIRRRPRAIAFPPEIVGDKHNVSLK